MSTGARCPSTWALERHALGELGHGSTDIVVHLSRCERCRARIAFQEADDAAFRRSVCARSIRRGLSARRRASVARWTGASLAAAALALLLVWQLDRGAPSLPAASREEQAVLRFQHDWLEAVRTKDVAALDRILADDYIYTDAAGGRSDKADDLRRARAPGDGLLSFKTSDVRARVYGDVAVVTGKLAMRGLTHGKPYDTEVSFTDTLARIDGKWRAVAAHVSQPHGRPKRP